MLFLSCRPFVAIRTFSTGLVGVENVITTKGLQDRNNLLLDRRTVEKEGQLILTVVSTEILFPQELLEVRLFWVSLLSYVMEQLTV
jgi:hypothetical protein